MIYIHIPFCRSFCTYCGFYSEICSGSDAQRVQNFVDALCEEIKARRDEPGFLGSGRPEAGVVGVDRSPETLYIGGGTPSALPISALSAIVEAIGRRDWEEFTVEVNPDDITPEYAAALRSLGVTRISMGVQSFDDSVLRWMNRRHDAAKTLEAFRVLREAGFDNISIDLIFGISFLDDALWEDTLSKALSLKPEHISAYQLSIDEESTLAEMVSAGKYVEADEEMCRRQYGMLCRRLAEAGYVHYEISNFALPGREAVHNSAYWARVPYIGFGPGAHSFDGVRRRWNSKMLESQADEKAVSRAVSWTSEGETLTEEDARVETIMLGLRRSAGLPAFWLEAHCDPAVLSRLLSTGQLEQLAAPASKPLIRIPERHLFTSDAIIRRLV